MILKGSQTLSFALIAFIILGSPILSSAQTPSDPSHEVFLLCGQIQAHPEKLPDLITLLENKEVHYSYGAITSALALFNGNSKVSIPEDLKTQGLAALFSHPDAKIIDLQIIDQISKKLLQVVGNRNLKENLRLKVLNALSVRVASKRIYPTTFQNIKDQLTKLYSTPSVSDANNISLRVALGEFVSKYNPNSPLVKPDRFGGSESSAKPYMFDNPKRVYQDILSGEENPTVWNAMHTVSQMGPKGIAFIQTKLNDPDPTVRATAAEALGWVDTIQQLGAIDPRSQLQKLASSDLNEKVRREAITSLGYEEKFKFNNKRQNSASFETIQKALADPDLDVRNYAAYAMGNIQDPRSLNSLLSLLQTSPSSQQPDLKSVVWGLNNLNDPASIAPLLKLAQETKIYDLRQIISKTFAAIGDPSIPVLKEELKSDNPWEISIAANAFEEMKKVSNDLIPIFIEKLRKNQFKEDDYANSDWGRSLLQALKKIGVPAVSPMVKLLEETNNPQLQAALVGYLSIMDIQSTARPLLSFYETHILNSKTSGENASMQKNILEALSHSNDAGIAKSLFHDYLTHDSILFDLDETLKKFPAEIMLPIIKEAFPSLMGKQKEDAISLIGSFKTSQSLILLTSLLDIEKNPKDRTTLLEEIKFQESYDARTVNLLKNIAVNKWEKYPVTDDQRMEALLGLDYKEYKGLVPLSLGVLKEKIQDSSAISKESELVKILLEIIDGRIGEIERLGKKGETIELVTKLVQNKSANTYIRLKAISTLVRLKPTNLKLLLESLLQDKDEDIRQGAKEALDKLGIKKTEAMPHNSFVPIDSTKSRVTVQEVTGEDPHSYASK